MRILPVTMERETGQRKFHFYTPCVFVVRRHASRVTAKFKCVHQECLSHIFDQPLLVRKFVSVYKCPLTSLSGKNLAKNVHSSYKRVSLVQPLNAYWQYSRLSDVARRHKVQSTGKFLHRRWINPQKYQILKLTFCRRDLTLFVLRDICGCLLGRMQGGSKWLH